MNQTLTCSSLLVFQESVHSALCARLQDRDTNILQQLFLQPTILTSVLNANWSSYIAFLSYALTTRKPKVSRAFRRAHLEFLNEFCKLSHQKEVLEQIFYKILFSSLLYTKPRQHTAKVAWEIIASSSEGGIGGYELLTGCGDIWNAENQKEGVKATRQMSSLNMTLVRKIAGRLAALYDCGTH